MKTIDFDKKAFIRTLFTWFEHNKRDLPWRKTYSPYHVWISEMMLQQTQMERGIQYFNRWIRTFQCPNDIANASLEKVLQLWEGLGYYSRAKNIYQSARIIRDEYNGIIPCDEEKIKRLAGIGDYTLCALMGIAFEKDYATIDANVERVFARLFNCTEKNLKKAIKPLVEELLPKGEARTYNQALMELGALVCKKNPLCDPCPLLSYCESKKLSLEKERPLPKEKKAVIPVLASYCIITDTEQNELIRQRLQQKLWNTMWEFLGIDNILVDAELTPMEQKQLARQSLLIELADFFNIPQTEMEKNITKEASCIRSNYTNHALTAYFFRWQLTTEQEQRIKKQVQEIKGFCWTADSANYAMPSHHRKAHNKYHKKETLC